MNNIDEKKEFFKALGLTTVSAEKRAMQSPYNNSNSYNNNNNKQFAAAESRKRPVRKRGRADGTKSHVFHLLTNENIKRKKDAASITLPKNNATVVPNVSSVALPSSIATNSQNRLSVKSPNLASVQKSVMFVPQNQTPSGIVLGQTIFQSPDGKKFVLVPSSSTKQICKPNLSVPQSPVQPSILPFTGNMKINNNNEITTPIYLPTAQKNAASNVASFTNAVTTFANILPNNNMIVSPPKTLVKLDQNLHITDHIQSSSASNILQLLNMTKSALNDAKLPMNSMNVTIQPQGTNQTVKFMKIPKYSISLHAEALGSLKSQGQSLPLPCCVSVTPSGIESPVFTTVTNNDASNASNSSPVVKLNSLSNFDSEAMQNNYPIKSNIDSFIANDNERITLAGNDSQTSASGSPDIVMIDNMNIMKTQAKVYNVTATTEQTSTVNTNMKSNITATEDNSVFIEDTVEQSSPSSVLVNMKANGKKYVGDPSKNLTNSETNCVVIQGKPKKKRGKKKNPDNLQYRRYGGPPFHPCNAPPAPNTPSSSTCCLYEHTLLKMATRGFWGNEMGKLQDVFRSIRCESIDLDTVEDVTQRCYGFVRRKLLNAGDEQKAMYNYMKNYIDEFDSFLERVYPVAIIAILIYLPTATDYSLVTWHGIPPTGWSEYRRAVVMREVFEVLYKFGQQFNMVPEYEKKFFDNPVKCPLLVPRLLDLRKDYSDPPTCFVNNKHPVMNNSAEDEIVSSSSLIEKDVIKEGSPSSVADIDPDELMKKDEGCIGNDLENQSVETAFQCSLYQEKNDCGETEDMLQLEVNTQVNNRSGDYQMGEDSSENLVIRENPASFISTDASCDKTDAALSRNIDPVFSGDAASDKSRQDSSDSKIQPDANGAPIGAEATVTSKVGVITARFAESIAAACGNTDSGVSSSTPELSDDSKTNQNKRRSSKRIASVSQRFGPFLNEADEMKLEKDFKKALKLSKLDSTPNSTADYEQNKHHNKNDQTFNRIPLTTFIKNSQCEKQEQEDTSDNNQQSLQVDSLPILNRSVAFEALWTQQSVEEPVVVLHDKTSYKLGEYLEKFPIETHCPPASTQIILCNERYNAREIFGYLRRGSQLVEQQGDDVVVDTTRTVKKNAVILAVRKVPPGKISKLVHPDLHLETYTGFLLPIGVAQPAKSKRSISRSFRMRKKSIQSKEEVVCKEEPKSPLPCSLTNSPQRHFRIENEDSYSSPPQRKYVRIDSMNEDHLLQDELTFADVDMYVKEKSNLVSVETQTEAQLNIEDMNRNSIRNITDIHDLEQVLNSSIQNIISSCLLSEMKTTETSSSCFKNLIDCYERAGNFLLNTAKTLKTANAIQTAINSKDSC